MSGSNFSNQSAPAKIPCLDPEMMRMLVDGDVPPARMPQIEEHLAQCALCREKLEKESGGQVLWEMARKSLGASVSSAGENDPTPGGKQPADPVLSLLEPSTHPEMLGTLGAYEIAGVLGKGGMGVVLKAYDPSLGRYVAIKILAPHLAANANARKRFAREAKAAAAVAHDHVIAIHGVSEFKGIPFLVMPLIRGESLQKRLRAEGNLPLEVILRVAMQTASGLAAAHAQGLIHRDVKPANILLGPGTERVTLTDFGLARAVDEVDLTVTGMLPGTPRYMSPEQARGEVLDARTDLFSLGLVIYEMAAGQSPFRADSSYAVMRKITEAEPRPLADFRSDLPDWLIQVIDRLLAKNPLDRLASARDLEKLLGEGLAHLQSPQGNASPRIGSVTTPSATPLTQREIPQKGTQTPQLSGTGTAWFWLRMVLLIGYSLLFPFLIYLLVAGINVLGILAFLVIGGLVIAFGKILNWHRNNHPVKTTYSPLRMSLQLGVFALGIGIISFVGYQMELQGVQANQAIWNQTNSLQNRQNEWNSFKGAISDKEWNKENDLIEYAKSHVLARHLTPAEGFSLFAVFATLVGLVLLVWALSFWKKCHPAWVGGGLGVCLVWAFFCILHGESKYMSILSAVNSREILDAIKPGAQTQFTDPVVMIADLKGPDSKEFQIHIKPGYAVFAVVEDQQTRDAVSQLSFWAAQPQSAKKTFPLKLQYQIANPAINVFTGKKRLAIQLTSDSKNLRVELPLENYYQASLNGPTHEAWVFPEADMGKNQKTVPLAKLNQSDPKSPKEAFVQLQVKVMAVKLPDNALKDSAPDLVFEGVNWTEPLWLRELGLGNDWLYKNPMGGKSYSIQASPWRKTTNTISREWEIELPPGILVDLTPVEVDRKSSRPISMLRGYCYNPSDLLMKIRYSLTLENQPGGAWPSDRPRITTKITGNGSEFPLVQVDGNPLWLLNRKLKGDLRPINGKVQTAWIAELQRGFLPAFEVYDSPGKTGSIEIRNRFHAIDPQGVKASMNTGIGTPWWVSLGLPAPKDQETLGQDETMEMELSQDGSVLEVLGQMVSFEVALPLIAQEGFSKGVAIRLKVNPQTPMDLVVKLIDRFKTNGYSRIQVAKSQTQPASNGGSSKEDDSSRGPVSQIQVILANIHSSDAVKAFEKLADQPIPKVQNLDIKAQDSKVLILKGARRDLEVASVIIKELDKPALSGKTEGKTPGKTESSRGQTSQIMIRLANIQSYDAVKALEKYMAQPNARFKNLDINGQSPNILTLYGAPKDLEAAREVIKELDKPVSPGKPKSSDGKKDKSPLPTPEPVPPKNATEPGQLVVPLRHSTSEEVVKIIRELFLQSPNGALTQFKEKGQNKKPLNIRVVADPATNSVILHGEPDDLKQIKELIDTLDKPGTPSAKPPLSDKSTPKEEGLKSKEDPKKSNEKNKKPN